MLSGESRAAWRSFYDSARYGSALDERARVIVHLAAAMALGCEP